MLFTGAFTTPMVMEGWSPTGKKIVGTYEYIPAVGLATFYRDPVDGTVQPVYMGETTPWWEAQITVVDDDGRNQYVDEGDGVWSACEIEWREVEKTS